MVNIKLNNLFKQFSLTIKFQGVNLTLKQLNYVHETDSNTNDSNYFNWNYLAGMNE